MKGYARRDISLGGGGDVISYDDPSPLLEAMFELLSSLRICLECASHVFIQIYKSFPDLTCNYYIYPLRVVTPLPPTTTTTIDGLANFIKQVY